MVSLLSLQTSLPKDPIDEIEIEFHGDKEHEIDVDGYKGKSGNITSHEEVTIPAECKPGTYHIHFTVRIVRVVRLLRRLRTLLLSK